MKEPTLWYGLCGYWTDDWGKLAASRGEHAGIPLCPGCGSPGFIDTVAGWWKKVDAYEAEGHPGYRAEIEAGKEKCPRVEAAK